MPGAIAGAAAGTTSGQRAHGARRFLEHQIAGIGIEPRLFRRTDQADHHRRAGEVGAQRRQILDEHRRERGHVRIDAEEGEQGVIGIGLEQHPHAGDEEVRVGRQLGGDVDRIER
jgi:hypothetical protein